MKVTAEGPTSRTGAALLPVPARLGEGYQSWGEVVGEPGTLAVPAPYPAAVPQGVAYGTAGDPTSQSADAPPVWKPGVYYQPRPASPPQVATDSDNQMPIPAKPPNGKPAVMARTPTFLRQQQVGWPITTPTYRWRA